MDISIHGKRASGTKHARKCLQKLLNQQFISKVCLLKRFHRSIKVFEVHLKWKLKVQFVKDPHTMVALTEVSVDLL